jgi:hypothetical protein
MFVCARRGVARPPALLKSFGVTSKSEDGSVWACPALLARAKQDLPALWNAALLPSFRRIPLGPAPLNISKIWSEANLTGVANFYSIFRNRKKHKKAIPCVFVSYLIVCVCLCVSVANCNPQSTIRNPQEDNREP